MRIGKLNRRVSLQAPVTHKDAGGQEIPAWTEISRPWTDIRYLSGREYATSDTTVSGATASIRMRYRTDLNAGMRIVYNGTIFNVLAVLPDEEDRDRVDLACSTGINEG